MKRIAAIGILAALLVLAVPAAAETSSGSIVGIVYRGWTQQDCENTFGKSIPITTKEGLDQLGLIGGRSSDGSRGPLKDRFGAETGCYCGRNAQGVDYIANDQKTGCTLCKQYEKNALYYTDTNAHPDGVIKVGNQDVGCRCAKKEGSKDFDKVEGNVCKYKDWSSLDNACKGHFPGSRACRNDGGETSVGATPNGVLCCCESGYDKVQDFNTQGGWKCEKGKGTLTDQACAADAAIRWGERDKNTVSECPADMKQVWADRQSATQEQLAKFNQQFAFSTISKNGQQLPCCCAAGYILNPATQKCMKDADDCTAIVPGSIKSSRNDADPQYPIKAGQSYNGKNWDPRILNLINEKRLECNCRKNTIPYGEKEVLLQCRGGTKESNVLFIGKTPKEFAQIFEKYVFNNLKHETAQVDLAVGFREIATGPYKGIIITSTGTMDFYNEDPDRAGKAVLEGITMLMDTVLGFGGNKIALNLLPEDKLVKYMTKKGFTKIIEERGATAVDDVVKAMEKGTGGSVDDILTRVFKNSPWVFERFGKSVLEGSPDDLVRLLKSAGVTDSASLIAKMTTADVDLLGRTLLGPPHNWFHGWVPPVAEHQAGIEALRQLYAEIGGIPGGRNTVMTVLKGQAGMPALFGEQALIGKTIEGAALKARVPVADVTRLMSGTGLAASLRAGSTQAFPASAFEYASEFFARWSMGQTLKQLLGYAARGLSLVWFDDLVKSTKGEAPTHSLGMAATNGAIGFAMGTWNCKFLGPWSLICGAVEGGMMFASEYADDTELDIKWENMNQVSTIENIVVSDSIKNCGKLEKGSGFKLPAQHYSGGKLEGWSLNSFAYQGTPCGMFSFSGFWDHLKSGGGFTISVIIPKGAELSCTDCGAMTSECQKKADTWKDPVSGEKICCKECTILQQDALLGGYHGMPSQKATAASGNLVSA